MLNGLEGTPIAVSLISTIGVIGVGFIGYLGIRAQLSKANDMNTSQHAGVYEMVKNIEMAIKDVNASIGLLISTQGFPMLKNNVEGKLIWANAAALDLLGLSFEDLADPEKWPLAIHPNDRTRVVDHWYDQLNLGRQLPAIEYRYIHPMTGHITYVRGMSRPILDPKGELREWVSMVVPLHDKENDDA